MARPSELVPGNCYFLIGYHDDDLKIPFIQTFLFEGVEVMDGGTRRWLFEDPGSSEDPARWAFDDTQLYQLLDLQGLRRELGALIHLHPLNPIPPAPSDANQPRSELPELAPVLDELFAAQRDLSVTLTIRYLDLGISFGRRNGKLHANLFVDLHDERQPEARLRGVFSGMGLAPDADYLAQHGRVRVLGYPLGEDRQLITKISHLVLIDVFGMRISDELKVDWLR